jgi:glycosyltransferase involved in cell wall biosynthesis
LKVRFVSSEFFSWNQRGGYGFFARKLGRELVKRGFEVECVVQHIMPNQQLPGRHEYIDGVKVITLPRGKIEKLRSDLYKTDADILHSESERLDTYLSFKRNPDVPKIVTIQDLRLKEDLEVIGDAEPKGIVWGVWNRFVDSLYRKAMLDADALTCQANLLFPKIQQKYGLSNFTLLPNFIDIPKESAIKKSDVPSVVFLGRLDPIKHPELFFKLVPFFPAVNFYILGEAHDVTRNAVLQSIAGGYRNLHWLGSQEGSVKAEILSSAWVLVNTSLYECLPVSFLEALSYKCALLSTVNPDDYTAMFGRYCKSSYLYDIVKELQFLLEYDNWRVLGEAGYKYVKEKHSTEVGIANHIELYNRLIQNKAGY